MTDIREQASSTSAGSGLAMGVDMYFDFLHRQIAVTRMFVVAGTRLATAIFSERGFELVGCGNRIDTDRIEKVTEIPIQRTSTAKPTSTNGATSNGATANGRPEWPELVPADRQRPTQQLQNTEASTGSLTLNRPGRQHPIVDQVFDEIVGYLVAADITGDPSTATRGMLVP